MFVRKEREYASCGFMDFEAIADFAEELSFDELLSVNGGCGGGCGGGGGGSYSPSYSSNGQASSTIPSNSSSCSSGYTPLDVDELIKAYNDPENVRKREEANKRWNTWWEKSNTTSFRNLAASTVSECGGKNVSFLAQRTFSAMYSEWFGEHACAATSLLNEISEQYSRENGRAASFADLALALDKAVNDGSIDKNNATVLDWNKAADSMSDYLGLKGDYTYTTDKSKIGLSDATIIQLRGSSGAGSHFVKDIGSGKYYDPWTNQTGNISDIENRIVGYRYLDYK